MQESLHHVHIKFRMYTQDVLHNVHVCTVTCSLQTIHTCICILRIVYTVSYMCSW